MASSLPEMNCGSAGSGILKGKRSKRAVIRRYSGNEDALKVILKIIKLLSEDTGGDKCWMAANSPRRQK